MKIRTVKPEFWQSPAVRALPAEGRLLFIGLWQYVDDNGVGLDSPALLAGEVFPGEMEADPAGTVALVDGLLWDMAEAGMVRRFVGEQKGSERRLIEVPSWERNQRISKPRNGHEYTRWREGMELRTRPGNDRAAPGQWQGDGGALAGQWQGDARTLAPVDNVPEPETVSEQAEPEQAAGQETCRDLRKQQEAGQFRGSALAVPGQRQGSARKSPGLEKGKGKVITNTVQNSSTVAPAENNEPVENQTPACYTWTPSQEQVTAAQLAGIDPTKLAQRLRREDATAPAGPDRPWTPEQFAQAWDERVQAETDRRAANARDGIAMLATAFGGGQK